MTMTGYSPTSAMAPVLSKVPAITAGFWLIKILATTFGETAGDTLSMSLDLGYLVSTAIFASIFLLLCAIQVRAMIFRPWLYWSTIIASTTAGTTLADFVTRSLGVGYAGGSFQLAALVALTLLFWHRSPGGIASGSVQGRQPERWYWLTITFSQTLGTALGDWVADGAFGYLGSAVLFGTILLVIAMLYRSTAVSRTALFWAAFVITRPLGAVVGDFLDKPVEHGGLDLSRGGASLVLGLAIIALVEMMRRSRPAPGRTGDIHVFRAIRMGFGSR